MKEDNDGCCGCIVAIVVVLIALIVIKALWKILVWI